MSELNPETEELNEEPTAIADEDVDHRVPPPSDGDVDDVLDSLMADEGDVAATDDTPAEEPSASEEDTPKDWDDLMRVLRRDNVPMSVIEATDHDTLRDWVNKAQKRQGDVDEYGSRLRELEDRLDKSGSEASDDGADSDADDTQPEADANATEVAIPDELADVIGDEAAQAVVQMIEAKYRKTAEAAQQAAAESQLYAQTVVADAALRPLYGDKAPEMQAVMDEASRLGTEYPNTYESVDAILAEAYRNLAGEPPAPKKKSSQPTPTSRQPRRQPKPPADVEDVALDALMGGGSKQDALRAIGR